MTQRKNILWLTSWFPNKTEPLAGDFIERHARAASLLNNIDVLFVTKGKKEIERKSYPESANATILYYEAGNPFVSAMRYFLHFRKLIKQHIAANGKPDLVNIHIAYRAGLIALYCKWFLGLQYVISEQWTIFLQEARPGFHDKSFLNRWLIKLIYRNAAGTSAVSEYLANTLARRFEIRKPVCIPNVVDTKVFYPTTGRSPVFRFIHISLLNYQKSPAEILDAVKHLTRLTHLPFEMVIYGPLIQRHVNQVDRLQLQDVVHFKGEVSHQLLSAALRQSHALVLYSRYETFGCVLIEAYASGVPVIVSDVPVMHENVDDTTGVFAEIENSEALAAKMLWMMSHHQSFDSNHLATIAESKYGFGAIARQFNEFYSCLL